jgi:hypothetical protein
MLDHRAVQKLEYHLGYPETALWIREYRQAYLKGVSHGFVVVEKPWRAWRAGSGEHPTRGGYT